MMHADARDRSLRGSTFRVEWVHSGALVAVDHGVRPSTESASRGSADSVVVPERGGMPARPWACLVIGALPRHRVSGGLRAARRASNRLRSARRPNFGRVHPPRFSPSPLLLHLGGGGPKPPDFWAPSIRTPTHRGLTSIFVQQGTCLDGAKVLCRAVSALHVFGDIVLTFVPGGIRQVTPARQESPETHIVAGVAFRACRRPLGTDAMAAQRGLVPQRRVEKRQGRGVPERDQALVGASRSCGFQQGARHMSCGRPLLMIAPLGSHRRFGPVLRARAKSLGCPVARTRWFFVTRSIVAVGKISDKQWEQHLSR